MNLDKLRKLATIKLECFPEDCQVKGNASCIDPETDKANEDWIINQLESGNDWAWCTTKVTASYAGLDGVDYLGCCSYHSEKDFRTPGGYYDDMVDCALQDLASQLEMAQSAMRELE
jgi:hypothetical protein